jgi:hypothetical protein
LITSEEAIDIARRATVGKATLEHGAPISVERENDRYVVTFVHENPPGVRGPDYDAKVTINAHDGNVIDILGAS